MHMGLYNGLLWLASPFINRHLDKRLATGKEDAARFNERLGIASQPRPDGELIWLHAASVGEAVSALSLVASLLNNKKTRNIMVTTGTRTSAGIMQERLPDRAFHQYIPVDKLIYVRRFLDHWRPDLAIWMESEIWPNLICETSRRAIPMMLVNARITEKSFRQWRRSFGFSKKLFGSFDYCAAQDQISADRLADLGVQSVEYLGNLKFASEPLPADQAELDALAPQINGRKVWLAASTHSGEESIIAKTHEILSQAIPRLLTIIVPRHPERGKEVAEMLEVRNIPGSLRSRKDKIPRESGIYIADTMGELGLFYRLCGVVLIGGSLVEKGGQNPIEPALLDCAILHGTHVENFSQVIAEFHEHKAIAEVKDTAELAVSIATYLIHNEARDVMAGNAFDVVSRGNDIAARLTDRVNSLMKDDRP